jgi:hypothetical protein
MTRWVIGLAGSAVAGYGGWLLLDRQDAEQIRSAAVWLVSGLLVHDIALTAVVLVAAVLVGVLPRAGRMPAAVALVVVGSLTLVTLPVLGRFGERTGNPTHLDRPYFATWVILVGAVALAVAITGVVRSRKREED